MEERLNRERKNERKEAEHDLRKVERAKLYHNIIMIDTIIYHNK